MGARGVRVPSFLRRMGQLEPCGLDMPARMLDNGATEEVYKYVGISGKHPPID
jgi:hypothetical protein